MDMDRSTAVSVIVPLYNRRETIARCLDSLTGQTLKEIEIVVVDDGSTDNGADVAREYQKKDDRIVLITQKNQGPGAARNAGIRACHGEYIGFVDCDDYVEPQMYEKLFRAVQDYQTDAAVCQENNVCQEADGAVRVLGETSFPNETTRVYERKQVLEWFLNDTYLSLNSVCFKLIRKTLFTEKEIWFPENYRHVEDLPVSAGIFSTAQSVAFVPESLYCYIHETGTRSTSCSLKKAEDIYQDMLDVMRYLKKAGSTEKLDNFVLGMKFSSLRQLYGTKSKTERKGKEARMLLKKWKRAGRKVKPEFHGKEIPVFHKMKILASYYHLEPLVCLAFKMLGRIPFFKYMV